MRVLLIEDDIMIGEALKMGLEDSAYAVDWVSSLALAHTALEMESYQVVLLDLNLPNNSSGLELLPLKYQKAQNTVVLIISAREQLSDKIAGLDLGADDYLSKPFHVDELLARIRAVVRRKQGHHQPILSNGQIDLNPSSKQACYKQQCHTLSAKEFALLEASVIGAFVLKRLLINK